nr:MAG TPA: hypothetical protein [Caudoviricetes sp.]
MLSLLLVTHLVYRVSLLRMQPPLVYMYPK